MNNLKIKLMLSFLIIKTYIMNREELIMSEKEQNLNSCCKHTCRADGCCSDNCKTGKCSNSCCSNGCCVDSVKCCSK